MNRYLIMGFAALLLCASCESPTKDFNIHINPTFYKYVVELELKDVSDPNITFSNAVTVTVDGKDAAAIYNIDGTRDYQMNFGNVQFMVAKQYEPTTDQPLEFRVKVSSSGYKDLDIPVVIRENEFLVQQQIHMINLGNLPSNSISASSGSGTVVGGTLAQPLVINTGSGDSVSQIQITVPTNILFLDDLGNTLTGTNLEVDVLSYSDTALTSQLAMPDGSGLLQQVEIDGVVSSELLDPTATFEINMRLDGTEVKGFTGDGVELKIPLPDHMFNDEAGRAYQVGDSIGMMSLSKGDNQWKLERSYVVQDDGDGLYATPKVKHLSYWRYCWRRWWWRNRNLIRTYQLTGHLNSNNGSTASGYLLMRVNRGAFSWRSYLALAGTFVEPGGTNPTRYFRSFSTFSNPSIVRHTFGSTYQLAVNESAFGNGKTFDVEITPPPASVNVGYRLYCSGSNAIVRPPAGTKLFYKESGASGDFSHLHTFTAQNLTQTTATLYVLEDGKFYDFRAQLNNHQVDSTGVLIEDGKIYDVTLPSDVCSQMGL